MAGATASRRTATFTSLLSTAIEKWLDEGSVEDTVFEPTPALWIFSQMCKDPQNWGYDITKTILNTKNNGIQSFQMDDQVSIAPSEGPKTARFTPANYSGPLNVAWQEEVENSTAVRIVDLVQTKLDQLALSFAERMNVDLYLGNAVNSNNILGIEQALPAETFGSGGTIGAAYLQWLYKQAANAYGGITRVAWTATTSGTGFEPCSSDGLHATLANFGYTSDIPNLALKNLHLMYNVCSKAATHPDLIISDDKPFTEYEFAASAKTQIRVTGEEFGGLNLGKYGNLKFKSAVWIPDATAVTQNASGTGGSDSVNGDSNIYLLTTPTWTMPVESGADFQLGNLRGPIDQHVSVRHMVWRGQVICTNPRLNGRIYSYGRASA